MQSRGSAGSSRCIRCAQADLICMYNDMRVKRGPKTGSMVAAVIIKGLRFIHL